VGASYTNVSVHAPLSALRVTDPALAAEQAGWTVLVAEDTEGLAAATEWAQELTTEGALALAVDVHDSDVLALAVVRAGEVVGSYDSYPNFFSDDEDRAAPSGLPGADLVALLESPASPAAVEQVLRFAAGIDDGDDPYLFEEARHRALVDLLGLPDLAVGAGRGHVPAAFAPVAS
jgi:hypothetical protein